MKGLLKNIVGAVAPTLGTALGGPMGGMAATMISEVIGVPNNTKAIEKGLAEATPEQMLELKKAETDFEIQVNTIGQKRTRDKASSGFCISEEVHEALCTLDGVDATL